MPPKETVTALTDDIDYANEINIDAEDETGTALTDDIDVNEINDDDEVLLAVNERTRGTTTRSNDESADDSAASN